MFSASRNSILASRALFAIASVLCDGTSCDSTGNVRMLVPLPYSLGPSSLVGDCRVLGSVIRLATSLAFALCSRILSFYW